MKNAEKLKGQVSCLWIQYALSSPPASDSLPMRCAASDPLGCHREGALDLNCLAWEMHTAPPPTIRWLEMVTWPQPTQKHLKLDSPQSWAWDKNLSPSRGLVPGSTERAWRNGVTTVMWASRWLLWATWAQFCWESPGRLGSTCLSVPGCPTRGARKLVFTHSSPLLALKDGSEVY